MAKKKTETVAPDTEPCDANEPELEPSLADYTAEDERHLAHHLMHELGAHGLVLLSVYPDKGTRVALIACGSVPRRSHAALADALKLGLEKARELAEQWKQESALEAVAAKVKPTKVTH